jgi:hypothetical protein
VDLVAQPSRVWIAIAACLAAFLIGLSCWVLLAIEPPAPFAFWSSIFMLVAIPTGFIELATRRYHFGPSVVRFRQFLLWNEKQIPMNMQLEVSIYEVVTIRDTDTGKKVVSLTKEFTRGGKIAAELSGYYRNLDRKVTIEDERDA